ncbi:MAG: hypothetical protein ABSD57_03030 [Verrucomicrobiota bacterium]|jgi:hypothetical protein
MPRIEEAALADTGQYSRNGAKYYFCWSFCWSSGQSIFINPCCTHGSDWRRGSESNGVFTDYQPQYPDLQGDFNADFTGLQEVSDTIRQLPDLTHHLPAYYSVIEEIVEGFVEGFLGRGKLSYRRCAT